MADDARLDRWTSVKEEVLRRAGTKGAFTILHSSKQCEDHAQGRFHVLFNEEKGAYEIARSPHQVLLPFLWCAS